TDEAENQIALGGVEAGNVVDVPDDLNRENADEREGHEQFDQEIADRESRFARPAAAAQDPVAQQRNVVVETHGLQTAPAAGAGPDHAFLKRQPGDDHVQKAADHRPEDERGKAEIDQRAEVQEKIQHDAKISAAICSGERSAVSMVRSATERYSG